MHLTDYMSQRWISSVQTTLKPIFSQKRLKPTKNCLEAVNNFISNSMVKMQHNLMNLTNYKSQRWIKSVQITLIPIFSQNRLKPTKIYLEAVNTFVSVTVVKMSYNPLHQTKYNSQMDQECLDNTYIHFILKEAKTNKNLLRSSKQFFQCFYGQIMLQSNAFE